MLVLICYAISLILIIVLVCFQRRDPVVSLAWVLCFIAFPVVGLLFFFIFGVGLKRHTKKRYSMKLQRAAKTDVELNKQLHDYDLYASDNEYADTVRYFSLNANSPYTLNNSVKIFTSAEEKYKNLISDIENATENINMMYFIIRDDDIGNKIIDALMKKAQEGVEVRVLYDSFGSILTNHKLFKRLKDTPNAYVAEFFPVKLFSSSKINHRNHRKIVVIDGKTAYMGGMNIGDEYMGLGKPAPWRDTHMRVIGDAVYQIQKYFCFDWEFSTNEDLSKRIDEFFPKGNGETGNTAMQIVASGPDSNAEEIKFGMMKMINNAKKYVYIQTPYFIPDQAFLTAIKIAAESGVDVRIMIPGVPDKKYVYHTTLSYIGDLLDSGVKVYCYNGFIHSKTIVYDNMMTTIGTTNIDTRSFILHFEINAFLYDKNITKENKEIFLKDTENSVRVTKETYEMRKRHHPISYMLDGFFRLFAPIM